MCCNNLPRPWGKFLQFSLLCLLHNISRMLTWISKLSLILIRRGINLVLWKTNYECCSFRLHDMLDSPTLRVINYYSDFETSSFVHPTHQHAYNTHYINNSSHLHQYVLISDHNTNYPTHTAFSFHWPIDIIADQRLLHKMKANIMRDYGLIWE